jgi:diguanylate cyclase (GGDEF)-like protein/PAS domain S-box-containing protein
MNDKDIDLEQTDTFEAENPEQQVQPSKSEEKYKKLIESSDDPKSYKSLLYIVIIIGLLISIFVGAFAYTYYVDKEKVRLEIQSKNIVIHIKDRMATYEQVLKSGVGLFNASDSISRNEWAIFVKEHKLNENYKVMQGFGYSEVVLPNNKQKHEERIRKEGFADFKIHPEGQRELYTSIIYLEPFDKRNIRAFGYDMFSEEVRRIAMMKAMQSGEAILSGKITLVQEFDTDIQAGFLMYLPVYKKGSKLDTPAQRVFATEGFVYAPFRANYFMDGLLGDMFPNMEFEIYDGDAVSKEHMLYDSNTKHQNMKLYKTTHITMNGRTWTLLFRNTIALKSESIFIIFLIPSLILILTLLLYLLLNSLIKAKEIALQASQKLHLSEERLNFALAGVGDGLWEWNLKTIEVYFSKRWKEILGFGEDEITSNFDEWENRVHPQDLEHTNADITAYLEGKSENFINAHRIKCKDGSYKWILARGVIVKRDSVGGPARMVGSYSDITVRKKMEREILKTNSLFQEAQKLTHLGNWEWDIKNNKLAWSDEIYRIFGLKPQEFAATYDAFINTIHIDDRALVQESVNKALKTGEDYSISHRIVLPDGTEKIVYEKGQVELDENKQPIRMVGIIQDITERFKREKELEVQSRILNSVSDSILVHNLDGTMIYVNESAYTTRGYTKDELMNMKIHDLDYHDEKISEKVFEENTKEIERQLKDKNQAIFEVSHKTKYGTILPLEVTTMIIHEDDKSYMISISRDISERKMLHKDLESSEKRYRELVENSEIGIFTSQINGKIIYANEALINIMGYESQKDFYKQYSVAKYKNPEQRAHLLRELIENGKVDKMVLNVLTKDNEDRIIQISAHIESDILSGIIMDVTQSKKAIEEITKLSKAIEAIDDIIIISDRAGVITFVNDAYVSHTGYSREESIGKTPSILKSGKHDKAFYKKMWKEILSGNVFRGLITNRKKSGELYYEEKTITPIKNAQGTTTSFISTGKDITERLDMQHELEKLASTDALSGIYNRHKFQELFKIEINRVTRYKKPLTVIMFDIDHFKDDNETYGHDVGDEVLKNLVNVVTKNIRNTDIFVRWGGEEFIILSPETEIQNATNLAEKLRSAIETASFGEAGSITCSFGVTHYKDKEIGDSFLKRVDDTLYKAKDKGRNRVIVI